MTAAVQIAKAIQEGSFIEDGDLVSSDLTPETISETIDIVSHAKAELHKDLRASSQETSGVDQWIAQAKKVQYDIQQCKIEAREIVQEHSRIKLIQAEASDAANKANLLEKEIAFTESLQAGLGEVVAANKRLLHIEDFVGQGYAAQAADELADCEESLASIKGSQVRSILYDFHTDLKNRVQVQLEGNLQAVASISGTENGSKLEIPASSRENAIPSVTGLTTLGVLEEASESLKFKLESFLVTALQTANLSSHSSEGDTFLLRFEDQESKPLEAIRLTQDYMAFLHEHLPPDLQKPVAASVAPSLITVLIEKWLTPSIPTDLAQLDDFEHMRSEATSLGQTIDSYGWEGAVQLAQWLEHAPRMWLTMRKAETLNAVRRVFVVAKGITHQVERVERQKASKLNEAASEDKSDDWDASWEDDDDAKEIKGDDEDTSGWGFDEEEDSKQGNSTKEPLANEDTADAWGWDEDEKEKQTAKPSNPNTNGEQEQEQDQEIVLTERYTITDIPDHLIEVIGRDISDATTLQQTPHRSLNDVNASGALLALPTLAIAMFRATASTHYSNTTHLGNMHLYNDSSYIADKLSSASPTDTASMLKFARAAYAREMDVQRTILLDLLDGAQGFANCTQNPYNQACDDAVASTVDQLRRLHKSWQPILSTSALLQSIGALLNTSIAKFINDVEDLEDISEAQSHRLAAFTAEFTSLQDLFLQVSGSGNESEEPIPMTAVYVPLWLKLQYLSQILESSLVDIEYLWSEGELSLEFESEEVVELVRALFADSQRRRTVVGMVKRGR